jgi:hypothetical protein
MDMQIAVHQFMGLAHSAQDWVGIFKASTKTQEGTLSLKVEIAPGVTITTWDNTERDRSYNTLIKPFSSVGRVIDNLAIGDTVVFSAGLLGAVIGSDDEMVMRPQVIAHFTTLLKLAESTPPR